MPTAAPRSLADQLRGWPDDRLAALLEARPDLATPAPHDSAQLAARVVLRTSVLRALDRLDSLELAVLQALVQQTDPHALPSGPESVEAALRRLAELALAWGEPLRPVTAVAELLRLPDGPPEPDLNGLDDRARAVLDTLVTEGAEGRWSGAPGPTADLVRTGLLVRTDERHVTVPWSVRVAVRAGGPPLDVPPAPATSARDQGLVDRAAAGAAFEVVRRTELLLDLWGSTPPAALRTGGLSVRDLKAAADLLQLEPAEAALVIETAAGAGLLATGMTDDVDAAWLPTEAFDAWQGKPVAEQWVTLVRAWLDSPRLVALVGTRVADKPVNALAPDLERAWLRDLRHDLLAEVVALPEGEVLASTTGAASLVRRLRWRRPRRPASRWEQVGPLLAQAAQLGVLALEGAPGATRALLQDPTGGTAAKTLGPLLPRAVDHVLVQADLTAIAPGPLEAEVARRLAMVADVESRGGATVYRFAAGSVRRAFDAGWSAGEVHAFLQEVSRTPLPQALTYLVDDVSRRFGTVRAGVAESFLRSDDETALAELVNAPGAESLRLRRIAPTVVVSDVPLATLLPRLRDLGVAPVVEAADGTVRVARPDVYRARAARGTRAPASARAAAHSSAVVTAIRAGDRAARSRGDRARTAVGPTEVIALLREHLEGADGSGRVVIGYVGDDGTVGERVVVPRRVEGGRLTAYDERSEVERSFALHRITAATLATR
ncbi:helicase-associated domain-containing protein [Nocardioides marmoraquaticus]